MIDRYVNTASTAGGNGTTNASIGADRAFASLAEAEAALQGSYSDSLTIWCCGTAADTTQVLFSNGYWSFTSGRYLYIRGNKSDPSGFHNGVWNTNVYCLSVTGGLNGYAIRLTGNATAFRAFVYDLQISFTNTCGLPQHAVIMDGNPWHGIFNTIVKGSGSGKVNGVYVNAGDGNTGVLDAENCIYFGDIDYGIYINHLRNCYIIGNIISNPNVGIRTNQSNYEDRYVANNGIINSVINDIVNDGEAPSHSANNAGRLSAQLGTNGLVITNWLNQLSYATYNTIGDLRIRTTSSLIGAGDNASVWMPDIIGVTRNNPPTIGPFENGFDPSFTRLDARFWKLASVSGFQGNSAHAISIKVGTGILLDSSGISVDRTLINELQIQEYTITAADVTGKHFHFSPATASTNQVAFTILGGPPQNLGTDYTCSDSTTINWTGLSLDEFIREGDEVKIKYPS